MSLDVPPEHTNLLPARCPDTSERFAWITFPFLSLITLWQNLNLGRYRLTAGSKLIGWNAPRHKCKLLCWPADIHSVTLSAHSSTSRRLPATRLAQGRNLQGAHKGRDLPMKIFVKKFIWVLKNPIHLREACSRSSTWKRGFSTYTCGLKCRSAAARLLVSLFRIPLKSWLFVCCVCCVGGSLGDELRLMFRVVLPGVSKCVWSRHLKTRRPRPYLGCCGTEKKKYANTFDLNVKSYSSRLYTVYILTKCGFFDRERAK